MSLVEFRSEQGWSRKDLARESGCPLSSIKRWEYGVCAPSFGNELKIRSTGYDGVFHTIEVQKEYEDMEPSDAWEQQVRRGKINEVKALPQDGFRYTIECRLRISKYTRAEACQRCEDIHGTTFDGYFRSGGFFVFWSRP